MKIAVIGGGASGLTAAISAAREGAEVVILERCDRVGRKILATGNGRCNYTNINADIDNYHGGASEFIGYAKKHFWVKETKAFFEELGMLTKIESGGKAYPYSLQASAVLDVLRFEAERLGVKIITDFEAQEVKKNNKGFEIVSYNGNKHFCDKVILSAGGKASPSLGSNGSGYEIAKKLGHHITKLFPALVQVKTETTLVKALKGIKLDAKVRYSRKGKILSESMGELLFCDYGVSGPAVFNISRQCSEFGDGELLIDLLPEMSRDKLLPILKNRCSRERTLENYFVGMINKKLGMTVMKYAGVLPYSRSADTLANEEINRLADSLKCFKLKVTGTMSWNNAQVTAGGIVTSEVNPRTLESKLCKGVFITGEILDIDGDCGGYNLQWAWTSGYMAGKISCASHAYSELEV